MGKKNLKTPLSRDEFGDAEQGARIVDKNGNLWEFGDIPMNRNPVADPLRSLISPNGERSWCRHITTDGNCVIVNTDEQNSVIEELNHSKVKIV